MINALAIFVLRWRLRPDWILRLLLIAGFPLASTAPLLGGLLASQGALSRQQRELAEEEIAIRCPIMSSIRRTAESRGKFFAIPSPRLRPAAAHARCAATGDGGFFTFRGRGHRLDLATQAPLLC
jgi:hypothetical protein